MDKLLGYFANHPEGIRAALTLDGETLRAPGSGRIFGWNLVSNFRGEPLVRSRPNEPRELTDVREVFEGVRTDSALVVLREGSRSPDSLDEGGPFRFGWWSGVVVGTQNRGSELRAGILRRSSDFLARLSGPRSVGHGVFALFLSRVHELIGMDDAQVERSVLDRALAETMAAWTEECARAGEEPGSLVIGVTHRDLLAVASRATALRSLRRNGMRDRALLDQLRGKELGKLDPERLRYVWIASGDEGASAPWVVHNAPGGVSLTVDRSCDLRVTEL
ncbi:MAG: hypothetical protein U0269_04045 [Polyangiales bacterium]